MLAIRVARYEQVFGFFGVEIKSFSVFGKFGEWNNQAIIGFDVNF
jgi:hypothetical protein